MIAFKEFVKQKEIAEKLKAKQENGTYTESDRQKWLKLDIKVRQIVTST